MSEEDFRRGSIVVLTKALRALLCELAEAQAACRLLAHAYRTDNRPPDSALEYADKLPRHLPSYRGSSFSEADDQGLA